MDYNHPIASDLAMAEKPVQKTMAFRPSTKPAMSKPSTETASSTEFTTAKPSTKDRVAKPKQRVDKPKKDKSTCWSITGPQCWQCNSGLWLSGETGLLICKECQMPNCKSLFLLNDMR